MFTTDQLGGIIRAVFASAAGFAVGKGWLGAGDAEWVVGGATTAIVGVWSWWTNRPEKIAPK